MGPDVLPLNLTPRAPSSAPDELPLDLSPKTAAPDVLPLNLGTAPDVPMTASPEVTAAEDARIAAIRANMAREGRVPNLVHEAPGRWESMGNSAVAASMAPINAASAVVEKDIHGDVRGNTNTRREIHEANPVNPDYPTTNAIGAVVGGVPAMAPALLLGGPAAFAGQGAVEGAGNALMDVQDARNAGRTVSVGQEALAVLGRAGTQAAVNYALPAVASKVGAPIADYVGGKLASTVGAGVGRAIGAVGADTALNTVAAPIQTAAENVVAGQTYDPSRRIMQGVPESAATAWTGGLPFVPLTIKHANARAAAHQFAAGQQAFEAKVAAKRENAAAQRRAEDAATQQQSEADAQAEQQRYRVSQIKALREKAAGMGLDMRQAHAVLVKQVNDAEAATIAAMPTADIYRALKGKASGGREGMLAALLKARSVTLPEGLDTSEPVGAAVQTPAAPPSSDVRTPAGDPAAAEAGTPAVAPKQAAPQTVTLADGNSGEVGHVDPKSGNAAVTTADGTTRIVHIGDVKVQKPGEAALGGSGGVDSTGSPRLTSVSDLPQEQALHAAKESDSARTDSMPSADAGGNTETTAPAPDLANPTAATPSDPLRAAADSLPAGAGSEEVAKALPRELRTTANVAKVKQLLQEKAAALVAASKATEKPSLTPAGDVTITPETPNAPARTDANRETTDRVLRSDEAPGQVPPAIGQVPGRAGVLHLADRPAKPIRYVAVEADALIPSHDARKGFAINPNGDANERPYHDPKQAAESRDRVEDVASNPKLDLLYTDTPTAIDGPPVIRDDGVVMGGNARSMGVQLAYHRGGTAAEAYRKGAIENAAKFGIDPAAVGKLRNPVIVRVDDMPGARGEMSRVLNDSLSAGKSVATEAVSRASKVSDATARIVAEKLAEGETLRKSLDNDAFATRVIQQFVKDGVWSEKDFGQFVNPQTKALSPEGKANVERVLVGRVVGDPTVLGQTSESTQTKLLQSMPDLMALSGKEGDLLPLLKQAIPALQEYRAGGSTIGDHFFQQQSLTPVTGFGDPQVAALVHALDTLGPRQFREAVARYRDLVAPESGGMFAAADPVKPAEAMWQAFGRGLDGTAAERARGGVTVRAYGGTASARMSEPESRTIQSTPAPATPPIAPRASFVHDDVVPTINHAIVGAVRAVKSLQRIFAPQTQSDTARSGSESLRSHNSQRERDLDIARESLKVVRRYFDTREGRAQRDGFIDRVEQGIPQADPKLQQTADQFRTLLDQARQDVQDLGGGALQQFYENYFPHIWKDPQGQVQSVMAQLFRRRPLQGSKSFLKQRTFATEAEGRAAGLTPEYDNPVDAVMHKLTEMRKFVEFRRMQGEWKAAGIAKYLRATEQMPEGFARVEDPSFTVYAPPTIKVSEYVDRATYDALENVAQRLGISRSRVANAVSEARRNGISMPRRGALGYSLQGGNKIVTQFATDLSVLAHEIGHQIDAKYDMDRVVGRHVAELDALTDLRYTNVDPATIKDSTREYNLDPAEQMAQVVEAYVHAPSRFQAVAPNVYKAFDAFVGQHPELAGLKTQASLSLRKLENEVPHGGLLKMGEWVVPQELADVVNNHVNAGLRGNAAFDAYLGFNNVLNQVQLAGFFHAGFTSADAAISRGALAIEQAANGHLGDALKSAASVPVAPITNVIHGRRAMAEWHHPGSNPELTAIVNALSEGGARAHMDKLYATKGVESMMAAFRKGNTLGGIVRIPGAVADAIAKPIMEYLVPAQKWGVMSDLMREELDRLGPTATREQIRHAAAKVVDSVDNRLGQVVYDNLFLNRKAKDLLMASMRSVGWNIGTVREIGGAVLDAPRDVASVATGKGFSGHRLPYTLSLLALTAAGGALIQYLRTGQYPEELKDYYFPKTGRKDANGDDIRVQLPTYMRDVGSLTHGVGRGGLSKLTDNATEMTANKTAPMLSALMDIIRNRDYWGTQIADPEESFAGKTADRLGHLGKQAVPFTVTSWGKLGDAPIGDKAAAMVGVTPAPKRFTQSPAEEKAAEFAASKARSMERTPEQADKAKLKADIANAIHMGKNDEAAAMQKQAIDAGKLNGQDVKDIRERASVSSLEHHLKHLDAEEAIKVYELADAKERQQIRGKVYQKLANSKDSPADLLKLRQRFEAAGK